MALHQDKLIELIKALAITRDWITFDSFVSASTNDSYRILIDVNKIMKFVSYRTQENSRKIDKWFIECIRAYIPNAKKYSFMLYEDEISFGKTTRFYIPSNFE